MADNGVDIMDLYISLVYLVFSGLLAFMVPVYQYNKEVQPNEDGDILFPIIGWIIGICLLMALKVVITAWFLYNLLQFIYQLMERGI
jgi:hypothetical protein